MSRGFMSVDITVCIVTHHRLCQQLLRNSWDRKRSDKGRSGYYRLGALVCLNKKIWLRLGIQFSLKRNDDYYNVESCAFHLEDELELDILEIVRCFTLTPVC